MPPGNRLRRSLIASVPLMAGSVMALVRPAMAHSLLVSRGEAVMHTDRIAVEIEIAAEDLLHSHAVAMDEQGRFRLGALAAAARAHTVTLDRTLVIRNTEGNRLQGGPFDAQVDWSSGGAVELRDLRRQYVKYTSTYVLPSSSGFVFFQLLPVDRSMIVPWQLVLNVRGESQMGQIVRLTSRGNVESVELSWEDGQPSVLPAPHRAEAGSCTPCESRGAARFKQVCADIEVDEPDMDVRLSIPLPLLSTWIALEADDDEFLDLSEQIAAQKSVLTLVHSAIAARNQAGPLSAEMLDVRFVSGAETTTDRISVWTGGLRAHARFHGTGQVDSFVLRWGLFNGAVLSGVANIHASGRCTEHEFSTYRPEYVIAPRGATPSGALHREGLEPSTR